MAEAWSKFQDSVEYNLLPFIQFNPPSKQGKREKMMTKEIMQKETTEENALIAEFDGWKVEPFDIDSSEDDSIGDDEWLVLNQYDSTGKRVRQITGWECANIEVDELGRLPYNTSWDWLMPVVEKIESLGHKVIIGDSYNVGNNDFVKIRDGKKTEIASSITEEYLGSKIENTYKAIVQFIHIHNYHHNSLK